VAKQQKKHDKAAKAARKALLKSARVVYVPGPDGLEKVAVLPGQTVATDALLHGLRWHFLLSKGGK
jgi:hypothetical protein